MPHLTGDTHVAENQLEGKVHIIFIPKWAGHQRIDAIKFVAGPNVRVLKTVLIGTHNAISSEMSDRLGVNQYTSVRVPYRARITHVRLLLGRLKKDQQHNVDLVLHYVDSKGVKNKLEYIVST